MSNTSINKEETITIKTGEETNRIEISLETKHNKTQFIPIKGGTPLILKPKDFPYT